MTTYEVLGIPRERADELYSVFMACVKAHDPHLDNVRLCVELANTKEEAVFLAYGLRGMA